MKKILIIIFIAILIGAAWWYVSNRDRGQDTPLEETPSTESPAPLTDEEKQEILEKLKATSAATTTVTDEEKQAILNELKAEESSSTTTMSDEEKRAILESLKSSSN